MQQDDTEEELLTGRELAEKLKMQRATLWRWRREGCPYIRLRRSSLRYRLSEVLAWRAQK